MLRDRLLQFVGPWFTGQDRRLTMVTTADHRYTFRSMIAPLAARGVTLADMPYERLLRLPRVGGGTWIFSDFDRLSPVELEAAGKIWRRLLRAGLPVFNDPRQFRPRHALLAHLKRARLNRISVWWPATGEKPVSFPVLLRSIAAHRGPIGDLCNDPREAEVALVAAVKAGYALADLVFVAFAAEPDAAGLWQKHAAFCVGDRIVRANTVNDTTWLAKHGANGVATAEIYAGELAEMTDYPHAAHVRRIFNAARITFGRIDFGIVDGQHAIYEINTNPYIPTPKIHPDPSRTRTLALMETQLADALAAVAVPPSGLRVDLRSAFARTAGRGGGGPRRP